MAAVWHGCRFPRLKRIDLANGNPHASGGGTRRCAYGEEFKGKIMIRTLRVTLAFSLLCVSSFFVLPCKADTTYTYIGNPYASFPLASSGYSSANSITATLDLANPLLPNEFYGWGFGGFGVPSASDTLLSFSESDGTVTFTSGGINFWITTNSIGWGNVRSRSAQAGYPPLKVNN